MDIIIKITDASNVLLHAQHAHLKPNVNLALMAIYSLELRAAHNVHHHVHHARMQLIRVLDAMMDTS